MKRQWSIAGTLGRLANLFAGGNEDIVFERIVSIEYEGIEQVWDISVKNTHNFVAAGLLAHNTAIFNQASTTQLSVTNKAYFGGTATTTIDSAGNIAGAGTLSLAGTSGTSTIASGQGFTIGSSQFVLQQGSGNVGIGTASPGQALDVVGNIQFKPTGSSNTAKLDLNGSTIALESAQPLALLSTGASTNISAGTSGTGEISNNFQVGGVTFAKFQSNTQANYARLALISGSANNFSQPYLTITSNGGATGNLLTMDSSGNVGIGTTSPMSILALNSGQVAAAAGSSGAPSYAFGNSLTTGLWSPSANALALSTNGSERLRIDSSGNVGIGTTSPATTFSVAGNGYLTGGLGLGVLNTTANTVNLASGGSYQINGANINTAGTLSNVAYLNQAQSFTALNQFTSGASTTLLSAYGPAYFGATATSSFATNGALTLVNPLTYGGVTLSNAVTGTGNMVLSASPTLTGTLTAAAANFSGLTTFSNASSSLLSVTSKAYFGGTATTTIDSAGNIVGAGTLSLNGTTGTSTIASGQGFTIGGSQFVLQQGSGNVGIGTTTPGGTLSVANSSGFEQFRVGNIANAVNYLKVQGAATGNPIGIIAAGSDSDISMSLQSQNNGVMNFAPNGHVALKIYNSGVTGANYFKIGQAAASAAPVLTVDGSDTNVGITLTPKGTGTTNISANNVGIGSSTPAATLSVAGSGYLTGGLGLGVLNTTANTVNLASGGSYQINGASINTAGTLGNVAYLNQAQSFAALNQFNGGASSTLFSAYGPAYFGGTATSSFGTNGSLTLASALAVGSGGTGNTTNTLNGVLYGNGSSALLATTQGAANSILTANAGAPSFSAAPTIGTSVTTPLVIGGTAVGSSLALQSTSGVGTADFIKFLVGNNGGTEAMRILDSGNVGVGTTTPASYTEGGTKTVFDLTAPSGGNPVFTLHSGGNGHEFNIVNAGDAGTYIDITGSAVASNNFLSLRTNNNGASYAGASEAMRITSSGNIGIGTSSPNSLLALGTGNLLLTAAAGTTNGGLLWNQSGSWQIQSDASSYLRFVTNNTEGLRINSSGNTILGGGTTVYGTPLTISGSSAGNYGINVNNSGAGNAGYYFGTNQANGLFYNGTTINLYGGTNGASAGTPLVFTTNNAERARIDASGNVGIGASPTARLTVVGAGGVARSVLDSNEVFQFNDPGSASAYGTIRDGTRTLQLGTFGVPGAPFIGSYTNHDFAFITNDAERARITAAGNVGIGNASPANKLDVAGAAVVGSSYAGTASAIGNGLIVQGGIAVGTTSPLGGVPLTVETDSNAFTRIDFVNTDGGGSAQVGFNFRTNGQLFSAQVFENGPGAVASYGGANSLNIFNFLNAPLTFGTNGAERMRISAGGNVGIGTTTPWRTLAVEGTVAFHSLTAGAGNGALCATTAGEVQYDAGANCIVSSQRFKNSIAPLATSSGLAEVMALNPVSFRYNQGVGDNGAQEQLGFIAEQANQVDSRLVVFDASSTPYSFRYQNFTAVLAKAIQEQQGEFDALVGSTTASTTPQSQSFVSSFFSNLFARLVQWFADAGNGIGKFFAQEVHTGKLCVSDSTGETCVTKLQLDKLLAGAAGAAGGSGGAATTSSATTSAASSASPQVSSTGPVITVNGNNPTTVEVGSTYSDLGATIAGPASDLNLGIKASVDGGGTTTPDQIAINTATVGTHTITYFATDQSGLIGYAKRTVNVVLPTPTMVGTLTASTSTPASIPAASSTPLAATSSPFTASAPAPTSAPATSAATSTPPTPTPTSAPAPQTSSSQSVPSSTASAAPTTTTAITTATTTGTSTATSATP